MVTVIQQICLSSIHFISCLWELLRTKQHFWGAGTYLFEMYEEDTCRQWMKELAILKNSQTFSSPHLLHLKERLWGSGWVIGGDGEEEEAFLSVYKLLFFESAHNSRALSGWLDLVLPGLGEEEPDAFCFCFALGQEISACVDVPALCSCWVLFICFRGSGSGVG